MPNIFVTKKALASIAAGMVFLGSANVWDSIDMTDINQDPGENYHMQEVDFTFSYDFSPVEGLDLGVGVVYYAFPGTALDSTQEAYASVTLSEVTFVTPLITAYYDFDEIEGWYATAALEHEFELTENLDRGVSASRGFGDSDYNMGYWGVDDSGLNDLNLSASLSYQVNDAFSAGYMVLVGSDVKDAVEDGGGDTSQFFMGLSAAPAF